MTVPIISGFHPDPSICQSDGVYYIANSSFEYAPGIPIHASTDLIHWELIGNALPAPEPPASSEALPSTGIYAPTLRHHADKFWLITTNTNAEVRGQILMTAERASGPWSSPVRIPVTGIDPDITWDGDHCYVSWARWDREAGPSGIWQVEIDERTGATLESPRHLWSGTGLAYPEGPHLYQVGDWWYLMIAEGGTERGHAISIARSRDIRGPYESAPGNPIFSHRSLDSPVQNTGHADLIHLSNGEWAAVYLAVRLSGGTPYFHLNGRETFLAGIEWSDGWPRFIEDRYEVAEEDHSFVDTFDVDQLASRWVSVSGASSGLHPSRRLLLSAREHNIGSLLLTRVRDARWMCRARLRVSDGSGRVILRIDANHWYGVNLTPSRAWAQLCIGGHLTDLGSAEIATSADVILEVRSAAPNDDFPGAADVIEFAIETGSERIPLGAADGRYLSTEVAGGFTGRLVGVAAVEGRVTLADFEYVTDP